MSHSCLHGFKNRRAIVSQLKKPEKVCLELDLYYVSSLFRQYRGPFPNTNGGVDWGLETEGWGVGTGWRGGRGEL